MKPTTELKPCPKCWSKEEPVTEISVEPGNTIYSLECTKCGYGNQCVHDEEVGHRFWNKAWEES